jgi:hypothetical protein
MQRNATNHGKKFPNMHRQHGTSLLEGIAYLGIAAIVILGAVSLLTSAFSGADTNRTISEVTSIRTAVKKLYMGQSASYGTSTLNADLAASKVFPTTVTVNTSTGAATNTWNGAITVTGASSQFLIGYTSVPQDVCINVVSGSSGWAAVQINGGTSRTVFPVTPAQASNDCSQSSNTIVWTAS